MALERIEGIQEAAVVGVPHPDFGEGVAAVVVGTAKLSETEMIAALKTVMAGYKVPKRIIFAESLPKNVMGKVLKNAVRDGMRDLFNCQLGPS